MKKGNSDREIELVGLVPAAGVASRLGNLPCSKEVLPIGYWPGADPKAVKVVCHHLLEGMKLAGVRAVHVVVRRDKWDIPNFLGSGRAVGMSFSYLVTEASPGPAWSLNEAHPFVKDHLVIIGFPDIVFAPADAFAKLVEHQAGTGADVVLGLFPAARSQDMDMVDVNEAGRVLDIQIKPDRTTLEYAWVIAVWTPLFTQFMHDYMIRAVEQGRLEDQEPVGFQVGDVLREALNRGVRLEAVLFPEGRCRDVGTPEDLVQSLREA